MPVDYVDATLVLRDGERSQVIFFVSGGEDITRMVMDGDPFVPVMRDANICIVARAAIACIGVPTRPIRRVEEELALPEDKQRVIVKLSSGVLLEGELRWTAPVGSERTADHLNNAGAPYVVLHTPETTYYVVKAHIMTVLER